MNKQKVKITYQRGNKYTKKWIGLVEFENGSKMALNYLYNGGIFNTESEIYKGIEWLKKDLSI